MYFNQDRRYGGLLASTNKIIQHKQMGINNIFQMCSKTGFKRSYKNQEICYATLKYFNIFLELFKNIFDFIKLKMFNLVQQQQQRR